MQTPQVVVICVQTRTNISILQQCLISPKGDIFTTQQTSILELHVNGNASASLTLNSTLTTNGITRGPIACTASGKNQQYHQQPACLLGWTAQRLVALRYVQV